MTFEILSTPVNSPASLIFQQCLAEVDPENRSLNSAMNEVGGYFLNKTVGFEYGKKEELFLKYLSKQRIRWKKMKLEINKKENDAND